MGSNSKSSASSRSSKSSRGRTVHVSRDGVYFTSTQQLITSLQSHRVNTLTELCRIERIFTSADTPDEDVAALAAPMTEAWNHYVTSQQFMIELQGLTPNYPFCGDIITEAHGRVASDVESASRSWNLPWLVLARVHNDGLIPIYAVSEAARPNMWGAHQPSADETAQLAACFEQEWWTALSRMLRHWTTPPTRY